MTMSEWRLVSIGVGFGEGMTGLSADEARSLGRSASAVTLENEGDTDFACDVRCDWAAEILLSSLGALGAFPNDRSRSSVGNSRLVGIDGRFDVNPGRTHCMLFGPPLKGPLARGNPDLSAWLYGGGGRGTIGVLSAFGPVGMFAGRLLGEVLIVGPLPLPTRGPNVEGVALGDASRGAYDGRVALEKEGDTLALRAA